jgi:hypothetical protein
LSLPPLSALEDLYIYMLPNSHGETHLPDLLLIPNVGALVTPSVTHSIHLDVSSDEILCNMIAFDIHGSETLEQATIAFHQVPPRHPGPAGTGGRVSACCPCNIYIVCQRARCPIGTELDTTDLRQPQISRLPWQVKRHLRAGPDRSEPIRTPPLCRRSNLLPFREEVLEPQVITARAVTLAAPRVILSASSLRLPCPHRPHPHHFGIMA